MVLLKLIVRDETVHALTDTTMQDKQQETLVFVQVNAVTQGFIYSHFRHMRINHDSQRWHGDTSAYIREKYLKI